MESEILLSFLRKKKNYLRLFLNGFDHLKIMENATNKYACWYCFVYLKTQIRGLVGEGGGGWGGGGGGVGRVSGLHFSSFSYFSTKMYVVVFVRSASPYVLGTHLKRHSKALLMIPITCLHEEKKKHFVVK